MESLLKDLKHSLRLLWRSPGFTIAALNPDLPRIRVHPHKSAAGFYS